MEAAELPQDRPGRVQAWGLRSKSSAVLVLPAPRPFCSPLCVLGASMSYYDDSRHSYVPPLMYLLTDQCFWVFTPT